MLKAICIGLLNIFHLRNVRYVETVLALLKNTIYLKYLFMYKIIIEHFIST